MQHTTTTTTTKRMCALNIASVQICSHGAEETKLNTMTTAASLLPGCTTRASSTQLVHRCAPEVRGRGSHGGQHVFGEESAVAGRRLSLTCYNRATTRDDGSLRIFTSSSPGLSRLRAFKLWLRPCTGAALEDRLLGTGSCRNPSTNDCRS